MTTKQKQVAKDLLENAGKPVSKAMLDAGYAPATAKNPQELTNSKGWAELMEEHLPDSKLMNVHTAGLEAMKQLGVRNGKDATAESNDFIEVEDHPTRHKFLETAYKLKGRYTDTPPGEKINVTIDMNKVLEKIYGNTPGKMPQDS